MIGIERHPLPPSGRHFPWWIFHCSDPSWEDSWGHNFQSLVYDFHRPQKLACVCQFRHVGFYSPVVYDTIDTQSFQVLDGGQVVLIICPSKDDLKMRHSWPLLVSINCSDYISHTWPLSLTKDNWLGSLRSASAMAESPKDRLSLPMIGCCTP